MSQSTVVLTLSGPDRVGIVEKVSGVILEVGGNVETSRMARLGGEFAILMLFTLPVSGIVRLQPAFAPLVAEGYRVSFAESVRSRVEGGAEWPLYHIAVRGADHEGIVHEIAAGLSREGINIESADTETSTAPVSGLTLFSMTAIVAVPPNLVDSDWMTRLAEAGAQANVDIEIAPES